LHSKFFILNILATLLNRLILTTFFSRYLAEWFCFVSRPSCHIRGHIALRHQTRSPTTHSVRALSSLRYSYVCQTLWQWRAPCSSLRRETLECVSSLRLPLFLYTGDGALTWVSKLASIVRGGLWCCFGSSPPVIPSTTYTCQSLDTRHW